MIGKIRKTLDKMYCELLVKNTRDDAVLTGEKWWYDEHCGSGEFEKTAYYQAKNLKLKKQEFWLTVLKNLLEYTSK